MFADIEVFALQFLVKYKDKLLNDFMLLVQSGKIPCCHYYNHFEKIWWQWSHMFKLAM